MPPAQASGRRPRVLTVLAAVNLVVIGASLYCNRQLISNHVVVILEDGGLTDRSAAFIEFIQSARRAEMAVIAVTAVVVLVVLCRWGTSSRDLPARRRLEQALREKETRMQGILGTALDAIMFVTHDGAIDMVNPTAERMFGYGRGDMIGRRLADLIAAPANALPEDASLADVVQPSTSGVSGATEFVGQRKDGTTFPAEMTISEAGPADRGLRTAIIRDVSAQKCAEESLAAYAGALETANAKLEAAHRSAEIANKAKSEFLANMSHEIRTPMTAILGFAENLLDDALPEDERLQALITIRRNGQHLLTIINDILDLSKIEAGKMTIERIECPPCAVVSEVLSLMQVRAESKHVALRAEYIGGVPERVLTDPTRLRQILINLVGNAIKFTPAGGVRMIVRTSHAADGRPLLQFDVIDSGTGMTPEEVGRIFRPFTQADTSMARRFGGTGLGLTISKRLAEMLGGDIVIAATEPGQGSTLRVTIDPGPLDGVKIIESPDHREIKPARGVVQTDARARPLQGRRVLLAEDGPDNQRLVSFVLRRAGAAVEIVPNGRMAVDAALAARDAGEPFDVILMDMQMPELDGYEASRLLRYKGYTGPIIALTAHAMAGDREKCLASGCDGFATKPIDRAKLIETIVGHIEGTHAHPRINREPFRGRAIGGARV